MHVVTVVLYFFVKYIFNIGYPRSQLLSLPVVKATTAGGRPRNEAVNRPTLM